MDLIGHPSLKFTNMLLLEHLIISKHKRSVHHFLDSQYISNEETVILLIMVRQISPGYYNLKSIMHRMQQSWDYHKYLWPLDRLTGSLNFIPNNLIMSLYLLVKNEEITVAVFPIKPWTLEKISGMFIVLRPIRREMKLPKITEKLQQGSVTTWYETTS